MVLLHGSRLSRNHMIPIVLTLHTSHPLTVCMEHPVLAMVAWQCVLSMIPLLERWTMCVSNMHLYLVNLASRSHAISSIALT